MANVLHTQVKSIAQTCEKVSGQTEEIRKLATNGALSVKNVVDIVSIIQSNSLEVTKEVSLVEQAVTISLTI